MSAEPNPPILRLRKKHAPGRHERPVAADGERLIAAQSLWHGLIAGIIAIVIFAIIWSMLTALLGRVFPWMTMLLGLIVGLAVRRAGHGLDWRFPALAAALAFTGSIFGNFVLAAGASADELGTTTLVVLRQVTTMTWPIFFAEKINAADWVFAVLAAGIAPFFTNRRLSRREYQALQIWKDDD